MLAFRRAFLPDARTTHGLLPRAARTHVRRIHATTVALKKKQKASSAQTLLEDADEVFSVQDELFGSTPIAPSTTTSPAAPLPSDLPTQASSRRKTPELLRIRFDKFESLYASTMELIGKGRNMRHPPRRTTVVRLVALADSREQLEKLVNLLAAWRATKLPVEPSVCKEFIGRSVHLGCPRVALQVLKDRPKYGMDLPSQAKACLLLKALAAKTLDEPAQTLQDALALAELYPLYGFPPASKDVTSCAILAGVIAEQLPPGEAEDQKEKEETIADGPFKEILSELEAAITGWGGANTLTPPKGLHWLRRHTGLVSAAIRRRGDIPPPWLMQFREVLKPQA